MKRIITVCSVVLLIGCIAVLFCGCGAKDEEVITTSPDTTERLTTTTTIPATNEGMVTDTSEKGDNGVIGDIVTDVSEGISNVVTDVSEDISQIVE